MRETLSSLRWYFIALGVFGLSNAVLLASYDFSSNLYPIVITSLFSLAYLYMGLRLRTLLPAKKRHAQAVLVAAFLLSVWNSAGALADAYGALSFAALAGNLVSLALVVYLCFNVERVSRRVEAGVHESPIRFGGISKKFIRGIVVLVLITVLMVLGLNAWSSYVFTPSEPYSAFGN